VTIEAQVKYQIKNAIKNLNDINLNDTSETEPSTASRGEENSKDMDSIRQALIDYYQHNPIAINDEDD